VKSEMVLLKPLTSWARAKSGISVRLLSPMGIYPSQIAFRSSEAAIVVTPGIAALVTRFSPIKLPGEHYISEVEFLSAFEIRALAATLLARKFETGGMRIYPVYDNYRDENSSLDLTKKPVLAALLEGLSTSLRQERRWSIAHNPPCCGGRAYDFNEHAEIDRRRFNRLFQMIDVEDHLLIRGLGALVKAGMLGCHMEFTEHACAALWIALDASLRICLREMRALGYVNPSAKDAAGFLDDAFETKYESQGYFSDFYEERIKTLHPENRFGTFPSAPLFADEYSTLNDSLQPVYEYLITGKVAKPWRGHDSY
jgi:hypothetical protein